MSEAKSNLHIVPQGTILGPINIFINYILEINSLPDITTITTISADDVQLLFSGSPNNLEQLKNICRDKHKHYERMDSENGLKMN